MNQQQPKTGQVLTSIDAVELAQLIAGEVQKHLQETSPTKSEVLDVVFTEKQLSERLKVTTQTIAKLRKSGKIPFIQIGSMIRYRLNDVLGKLNN